MGPALEQKRECEEGIHVDDVTCVRTVCQLYTAFATLENGVDPADEGNFETMIELWFQFAIIWGIGGCLDALGRRKCGPPGHV